MACLTSFPKSGWERGIVCSRKNLRYKQLLQPPQDAPSGDGPGGGGPGRGPLFVPVMATVMGVVSVESGPVARSEASPLKTGREVDRARIKMINLRFISVLQIKLR